MIDNYINRLIDGDRQVFDVIYTTFKSQFIALFRKVQGLGREEAETLFHDACAILLNNVESGRLTRDSIHNSQLKAYLNNTGKYILFNKRRKRQVPLSVDTDYIMTYGDLDSARKHNNKSMARDSEESYDTEMDDKLFIIRTTVRDMPQPCDQLLKLVIYMKKSNKEVAEIMNYANADSVKTQRSRCMKKLGDKVKERFKAAGYEQ